MRLATTGLAAVPQVLVYGPPSGPMTEWQQVADLSEQLLLHLGQTGWQDLDPQQLQGGGGGDGGDSTLRLRGGGRSKRPAQRKGVEAEAEDGAGVSVHRPEAAFNVAVGQAVEVSGACRLADLHIASVGESSMPGPQGQSSLLPPLPHPTPCSPCHPPLAMGQVMTAEEGLEGCWFTGAIQALSGGWALVAYDELQESEEEGAGKLREWFPVPGQHQAAAPAEADGGAQHTVHATASGHELRPAPPAKASMLRPALAALRSGWVGWGRLAGILHHLACFLATRGLPRLPTCRPAEERRGCVAAAGRCVRFVH